VEHLRDVTAERVRSRAADMGVPGKRALFITEESERCPRLAEALRAGDRTAIGQLTRESFEGARDLYEICSDAMSAMMTAMMQAPGGIGARQAGAGFGGCMVAFVERERCGEFAASVAADYEAATGRTPEIFEVEAAEGAGVLK
jgi:galactokinase